MTVKGYKISGLGGLFWSAFRSPDEVVRMVGLQIFSVWTICLEWLAKPATGGHIRGLGRVPASVFTSPALVPVCWVQVRKRTCCSVWLQKVPDVLFSSSSERNGDSTALSRPLPFPLTPFLRSIRPCLRVPLVISPGWHVPPLAHCLVFRCESASCAAAFIRQHGRRWRDEHKQRERETAREAQALSLLSFLNTRIWLLWTQHIVVSVNPLSLAVRAAFSSYPPLTASIGVDLNRVARYRTRAETFGALMTRADGSPRCSFSRSFHNHVDTNVVWKMVSIPAPLLRVKQKKKFVSN